MYRTGDWRGFLHDALDDISIVEEQTYRPTADLKTNGNDGPYELVTEVIGYMLVGMSMTILTVVDLMRCFVMSTTLM